MDENDDCTCPSRMALDENEDQSPPQCPCLIGTVRDPLLEILHRELKKKEMLYKNMIDEYEELRFKHCSLMQELGAFKEVYKQLELENNKLRKEKINSSRIHEQTINFLKTELEQSKTQNKTLQNKSCLGNELKLTVGVIEEMVKNQTETINRIVDNCTKRQPSGKSFSVKCVETTLDCTNLEKIIQENRQLRNLINRLKEERDQIRKNLNEHVENLICCVCTLEDQQADVTALTGNLKEIVTCNIKYKEEVECLKEIIEKQNEKLNKQTTSTSTLTIGSSVPNCFCKNMRTMENKLRDLEHENQKLNKQLQESFQQESISNTKSILTDNSINNMKNTIKQLEVEKQELLEKLHKCLYRQQNSTQTSDLPKKKKFCSKLPCLKDKPASFTEDVDLMQETVKDIKRKYELCTAQNEMYVKEIEELAEGQEDYESMLDECERENEELRNKLEKYAEAAEDQMAALRNNISNLEKKDANTRRELECACQEMERIKDVVNQNVEGTYAMNEKVASLEVLITKLQDNQKKSEANYQAKVAELEKTINRKQKALTDLEHCLDETSALLNECEETIQYLKNENADLKRENEQLSTDSSARVKDLTKINDDLIEQLMNLEKTEDAVDMLTEEFLNLLALIKTEAIEQNPAQQSNTKPIPKSSRSSSIVVPNEFKTKKQPDSASSSRSKEMKGSLRSSLSAKDSRSEPEFRGRSISFLEDVESPQGSTKSGESKKAGITKLSQDNSSKIGSEEKSNSATDLSNSHLYQKSFSQVWGKPADLIKTKSSYSQEKVIKEIGSRNDSVVGEENKNISRIPYSMDTESRPNLTRRKKETAVSALSFLRQNKKDITTALSSKLPEFEKLLKDAGTNYSCDCKCKREIREMESVFSDEIMTKNKDELINQLNDLKKEVASILIDNNAMMKGIVAMLNSTIDHLKEIDYTDADMVAVKESVIGTLQEGLIEESCCCCDCMSVITQNFCQQMRR